ncbi:MAG: transglycosylase SLT domain-containing protein [Thiotrichaceae bacterium]
MPLRFLLMLILASPLLSTSLFANSVRHLQFDSFGHYVNSALNGEALEDFEAITAEVENNIFWKNKAQANKYQAAFIRSSPVLQNLLRDDLPDFVFLIPYLESGWHPTKGKPSSDYGYWQMITDVVTEIKTLDQASDKLRDAHPNDIRSDPELSTEAALIHLKRYYFYFRHVANFEEGDAWLFTVTAFNWGSGNIKRTLVRMRNEGVGAGSDLTFADFYHYLFQAVQKHPKDKSMRVALEYVPNLWNIALLIETSQRDQSDSANTALTLNRSSSVSIP